MNTISAGEMAARNSIRREEGWRGALVGLTPTVVAIVAALMFIRALSTSIDGVIVAAIDHKLAAWSWNLLVVGWGQLLLMAAPMLVAIIATGNLGPQQGPKRIAALTAAVVLSAGAGGLLRIASLLWFGSGEIYDHALDMLAYVWPRYVILGGMLTAAGEFYRREATSIEAMQQADVDRLAFEREMTEARLQVLQAQVEPHFLFNTLANLRRLYDQDRAAGSTMLDSLMRYLEVALPRMRHNESTLERDAELVDAYLRIQRVRMGERLAFSIDIPAPLRAHHVPPMMLLTLVENAIKHGLNPSPDGGRIHVMARAEGDRLSVSVADTGVGFAPGSGAGTGLANVCARLAAQFGQHASLALENNELGGATATIVLPLAAAKA